MVTVTGLPKAEAEVVDLVSALIRFDTSNTGEPETTKGEAECARWVAGQLEEVGYTTEYVEAGAPGRGTLSGADHHVDPGRHGWRHRERPECAGALVLPDRIELSTSPLPRECSTTELRQRRGADMP